MISAVTPSAEYHLTSLSLSVKMLMERERLRVMKEKRNNASTHQNNSAVAYARSSAQSDGKLMECS